jgi:hypothetical protein
MDWEDVNRCCQTSVAVTSKFIVTEWHYLSTGRCIRAITDKADTVLVMVVRCKTKIPSIRELEHQILRFASSSAEKCVNTRVRAILRDAIHLQSADAGRDPSTQIVSIYVKGVINTIDHKTHFFIIDIIAKSSVADVDRMQMPPRICTLFARVIRECELDRDFH